MQRQGFTHEGTTLAACTEYSPTALGLKDLDLKTTTATFTSNKIPIAGATEFFLSLRHVIVGTTPTTGAANMTCKIYAVDGSTQLVPTRTLFATIDLVEAAGTNIHTVQWTSRGAGALAATVSTNAGTAIGTPLADCSVFKNAAYVEFIFDLTAVVNAGTSSTLNCYFKAGA